MDDPFLDTLNEMREKAQATYARAEVRHRDALASLEAARERLEAVDRVISMHTEPGRKTMSKNAEDSRLILDIVKEANSVGLLSSQVVAEMEARGVSKSVTSVGMYLSKLKAAGKVEQVGRNWRVPPENQEPASADAPAGPVSSPAPNGSGHIEDPISRAESPPF